MLDAGAEVRRDRHVPGIAAEALRVGTRGPHARDQHRRRREIARKAAGENRFVAGSIGPTGFLPASDDPTLGQISFRELVTVFTEQAQGLVQRRRRPDHHRDRAGHPRGQGGGLRRPRGVQARPGRAVPIQCSVSLLPNGGKMLLGTDISAVLTTLEALDVDVIGLNCSTGPEDMRDAIRFLGEYCPVPVHCIPNAGLPLQGPNGETIFPEQPGPLAERARRVRRALRRRRSSAAAAARRPSTSRRSPQRVRGRKPGDRPASRPPHVSSMIAATPLVQDPGPDAGRRARQLPGLAQGQGAAARRRLRRARDGRRGSGAGRRARARRLRRADRAPGRGRADAAGRQDGSR